MNKKVNRKKADSLKFLKSKNFELGLLLNEIESPEDQTPGVPSPQPQALQPEDSLSLLLQKAQKATANKPKSKMSRKQSQKQKEEAFLTGVEVDEVEKKEEYAEQEALDEEVKRLLQKRSMEDDLKLLRKEIRETNVFLQSYEKGVLDTKKEVDRLAGRYNSYFNLKVPVSKPTVDFSGYSVGMRSVKQLQLPNCD